jgi:hypothetical protein
VNLPERRVQVLDARLQAEDAQTRFGQFLFGLGGTLASVGVLTTQGVQTMLVGIDGRGAVRGRIWLGGAPLQEIQEQCRFNFRSPTRWDHLKLLQATPGLVVDL